MSKLARGILLPLSIAVAGLLAAAGATAQNFPVKPIRIIVGSDAGGPVDLPARWVAQKLSDDFHSPVLVDYKGGAAGKIAMDFVAKAPPDGYTLFFVTNGLVLAAINPAGLPFDPIKDFAPIAMIDSAQSLFVAKKALGVSNMKEFIAYAKQHPGKVTYGSSGIGSSLHLYGEMLKSMAGIDMLHVPYKGGGPATNDLLAGRIDVMFLGMSGGLPLVKAGKLVALGGAGMKRSQFLPDLPSIHEQGVTGFDTSVHHGISTTGRTPTAVIGKIHAGLAKVMAMPDTKKAFADVGLEAELSTPAEFDTWVRTQVALYRKVIESAGIQMEQ